MAILITDEDQPGTDSGYTRPFDQLPPKKALAYCANCGEELNQGSNICPACEFEHAPRRINRDCDRCGKSVITYNQQEIFVCRVCNPTKVNADEVREANRVAAISEAMHIIRTLNSHKITFNVTFDISFIRFKVIGEHQISRANNLIHTSFEKSYYAERWTGTLNLAW